MDVGIATARIHGLTNTPVHFKDLCFYGMSITFSETSTMSFDNITPIVGGKKCGEALWFCTMVVANFFSINIVDGYVVSVIFDEKNGSVIAIGASGRDAWIDVKNKFTVKTFNELKIKIDSLTVHPAV